MTWYQFKVPVRSGEAVGSIKDFKSIRFMRMFLTGFEKPIVLRFATLELVRGEWRTYTDALNNTQQGASTTSSAALDVSAVNIEENGDRTPVNYVMPPGISRVIDPGQPQLRQQNEQAMSLKLEKLAPGDARAVYKNTGMDMRQYRRLQMFSSASAQITAATIMNTKFPSHSLRTENTTEAPLQVALPSGPKTTILTLTSVYSPMSRRPVIA